MQIFRILTFFLSLALLPAALLAQDASTSSDVTDVFPYTVEKQVLSNGLTVYAVPTGLPDVVSLQITVETGSRNEVEEGKSGFAHFFEHMMFRGTENYSNEEYGEILKNAGADQNAYTTDDYTNYHITFTKEDLETVLELEADRFQNLSYSREDFKTEARAVLGEYNKNFANPISKLLEVQRDLAFDAHTYQHTTMGFLKDIEDMPNQYDYSLEFFDRYYRPNNTTIVLAGDVNPQRVFDLVSEHFGEWERGEYEADIPTEPAPDGPLYEHINWESQTLPIVSVAFRGPAFSTEEKDMAAMSIVQSLAFSNASPLYQNLVVKNQTVQNLGGYFPNRIDPYLLTAYAMVKDKADLWQVRDAMQHTFAELRAEPVSQERLEAVKNNLRYGFTNQLEDSESIGSALPPVIALTGRIESINDLYALLDDITPEDVQRAAQKFFTDQRMVVVTLAQGERPDLAGASTPAGSVDAKAQSMVSAGEDASEQHQSELTTVLMPSSSPLVSMRVLFNVGSADDPEGKAGLAELTARMIADGSSRSRSYEDIQQALYPMAAGLSHQVDKEMTVFAGSTHKDNLTEYYDIISDQILSPAFRPDDFERLKSQLINDIRVNLRANNDEELAKEVLFEELLADHPYGTLNLGHVRQIESITLEDVKSFYEALYTTDTLRLGMAGDYGQDFLATVKSDFASKLPSHDVAGTRVPDAALPDGPNVIIVDKPTTRSTGFTLGFPIEVNRAHEDFAALWLARSYFGEHRSSNSYLYQRLREIRGMNYGDYAYIEYFPRGMYQFHPDTNLAREQQIFHIWIRPVPPEQAHFAFRATLYELNKLIEEGLTEEEFEGTRNFLNKFAGLLTASEDRQLGYALDSEYYGIDNFARFIRSELNELTVEDVNAAIKEHLNATNYVAAFVAPNAQELKTQLVEGTPSPMSYDAAMPDEILEEDKMLSTYETHLDAEDVEIVPVDDVFE